MAGRFNEVYSLGEKAITLRPQDKTQEPSALLNPGFFCAYSRGSFSGQPACHAFGVSRAFHLASHRVLWARKWLAASSVTHWSQDLSHIYGSLHKYLLAFCVSQGRLTAVTNNLQILVAWYNCLFLANVKSNWVFLASEQPSRGSCQKTGSCGSALLWGLGILFIQL